jgi:NAD(P)-dependent dehydrogenase (short-subunit alcohol dehydrogenase family)
MAFRAALNNLAFQAFYSRQNQRKMDHQLKHVLITGANEGIGKATAMALAKKGFAVIMACRNMEKAEAALAEIKNGSGNSNIELLPLDLSDLNSVQKAARLYRERYTRLDVLLNNAGIITSVLEKTAQGFERQFGVNHLGHYLLTRLLLDMVQAAPEPRIVNVSSHLHYRRKLDFGTLRGENADSYDGINAYGQSKLANILFTRELARRYPGIACNALHPGVVRTRFGNKPGSFYSPFWTLFKPFLVTVEKGARTSVLLASDASVAGVTGKYFWPRMGARYPSRTAQNPELALQLWDWSEEAVKEWLV